jgi:hypothetical protein
MMYSRNWGAVVLCTLFAIAACGGDDKPADTGPVGGSPAKMLENNKAGLACTADKDCGSGQCLKKLTTMGLLGQASMSDAPGGYCSFACKLDVDCGKGAVCIGARSALRAANVATAIAAWT